jgi:hypothetical protein
VEPVKRHRGSALLLISKIKYSFYKYTFYFNLHTSLVVHALVHSLFPELIRHAYMIIPSLATEPIESLGTFLEKINPELAV